MAALVPDDCLLRFALTKNIIYQAKRVFFIRNKCRHLTLCFYGEAPLTRDLSGGSIAQWLEYLLQGPGAPGLIPSVPPKNSEEKICQCCCG